MMTSSPSSHRSRRILLLSILINLSSTNTANAFSYIQNAAATSSSSRDGDNNNGSSSSSSSALASARGRSAALAVAVSASAATITPLFRGSINSRSSISRQRTTTRPGVGRQQQQQRQRTSSDDFALRMMDSMMQSSVEELFEADENEDCGGDHEIGANNNNNNNCQTASTTTMSEGDDETTQQEQQQQIYERRNFLHGMLATTAAAASSSLSIPSTEYSTVANAYEQSYPLELQSITQDEVETSSNSITKLNQERITQKKLKVSATKNELRTDPLGIHQSPSSSSLSNNYILTIAGASTWALALWLASGSRSNPLVTPLANVLYGDVNVDESNENESSSSSVAEEKEGKQQQQWLTDRNDGYFGELPIEFMAILSAVFVFCGVIIDRMVYFLADGDAEVSFQLAGVSAISGAVWEVGRLATKEKAPTREEYDRDVTLYKEFEEFANKRIIIGRGSCHRSDVINAFRRYNPKYRVADNEQYPLADIEIERILKAWNREFGSGSEMTSAGFVSGISVDGGADDIFA